ncbi:hypothetical protein SKAU_G00111610 [Synaphobranchus kaupii]|uniref:Uncharacterized protein n=1 Tax=Synaphobranchus kaupii TaxID=118154 RepID=A0A9Q1J8H6_SYNKA|nr:hypothetical protein SKAU_G00111610 [Synaphobranchus kaupii]
MRCFSQAAVWYVSIRALHPACGLRLASRGAALRDHRAGREALPVGLCGAGGRGGAGRVRRQSDALFCMSAAETPNASGAGDAQVSVGVFQLREELRKGTDDRKAVSSIQLIKKVVIRDGEELWRKAPPPQFRSGD